MARALRTQGEARVTALVVLRSRGEGHKTDNKAFRERQRERSTTRRAGKGDGHRI